MPADATTSSTLRLLISGPVPGWAGLLLFALAGALVVWQLRREFTAAKRTALTRRTLPALRLAIVGLIAWLLCQPVLLIVRRWTPPAEVMLVVDSGNSMRVDESGHDLSRQLDALEAIGKQPIARRNNAASRAARASAAIATAASAAHASLQDDLSSASTGLPLGPSVRRKLTTLATALRTHADSLVSARAQLPADVADKDLKQSVSQLAAATQLITAAIDTVIADGAVVAREASKTPSLLDAFLARLKKLATDAQAAKNRAGDVQAKLDKNLLTEQELSDLRARAMTRQSLADTAADRLTAPTAAGAAWDRKRSAAAVSGALDDAFHKSLTSPLSGVVLLSDGSSPLPESSGPSSLAQIKVPVSTVLIGADGEEPPDAGLIAVDVPRLAIVGDAVTVRCLVKNLVSSTPPPKLTLTIGKETVASRDLTPNKDGAPDVVELAWTPAAPGRHQLLLKIDAARPDAYPGNESSAAIVDVMPAKAHILTVSDRLTPDFAAITQILAAMPAVDARAMLAAPGLAKFRAGSKVGDFPATADDFKTLAMLVLIGDVPDGAGPEVIQSLKQAIDAGLRVWIQAPAANRAGKSWCTALGIQTRPLDAPRAIQPVDDLWLDLYQLGRETQECQARWKSFPPIPSLTEIVTPGLPLLTSTDGRPILQLVPGKGPAAAPTIVCGIGDFSALRTPDAAPWVNRLIAQTLALGLTPVTEPGQPAGVFPPQPVLDHALYIIGDGLGVKGLQSKTAPDIQVAGIRSLRVSDPQSVALQIAGAPLERAVRRLPTRQDFQLAAHAAPLEKIAKETGGQHRDLLNLMDVLPKDARGTPRSSTTRVPLWSGPGSLVVLLALVSAEYLLRRRAGKVM